MTNNELEDLIIRSSELIEKGDFDSAIEILTNAYEKDQNPELNVHLVSALFFSGKNEEAFSYLSEMPNSFSITPELQELAIRIAVNVNQFLFAREFLLKNKLNETPLKSFLDKKEIEYSEQNKETVENNLRSLIYLGAGGMKLQETKFEQSITLPFNKWMSGAMVSLIDPNVSPLLRATMIEIMVRLKVEDSIDYLWIDGKKYSIVPSKHSELLKSAIYKRLAKKVVDDNPEASLNEMVLAYLRMTLSIIYPRLKIIKNEQEIIDFSIEKANGKFLLNSLDNPFLLRVNEIIDATMQELN